MNLTQLTVFREVMETGSISQAAKQLGRTQPAISLAIKNLEKTLGLALFERRGRQLVPVPEAHYLMVEATSILDRMGTVSGTMKTLGTAQTGNLNIAAMPGPSAFLIPKFVSEHVKPDANFQTTISSRSSSQIRELANSQSIDFGFADFDVPTHTEPRFTSEIVGADCFCALRKDHPLSTKSKITVPDLDGVPIGTLHGDHPLPRQLAHVFERDGAALNTHVATQFFLPLLPFISLGHCCAIVDPLTVVTEKELNVARDQIVFIPFDAPIRYKYATLTPAYRPASKYAMRVKDDWMHTLLAMLDAVGSHPTQDGDSK